MPATRDPRLDPEWELASVTANDLFPHFTWLQVHSRCGEPDSPKVFGTALHEVRNLRNKRRDLEALRMKVYEIWWGPGSLVQRVDKFRRHFTIPNEIPRGMHDEYVSCFCRILELKPSPLPPP